jgi:hypothetical protein
VAILPEAEVAYLENKGLAFTELSEGAQHALVLKGYQLPLSKYDHQSADILILLPAGFPDTPPDMFYLFPWIRLADGNRYPRAADAAHHFAGLSWQRWSRHSNEWRPGRDGLASFIKRIQHALETAAV